MNVCSGATPRPQPPSPRKACVSAQPPPAPFITDTCHNTRFPRIPAHGRKRKSKQPTRTSRAAAKGGRGLHHPPPAKRQKANLLQPPAKGARPHTARAQMAPMGSHLMGSLGAMTRFATWAPPSLTRWPSRPFKHRITSCQTQISSAVPRTQVLPRL